MRDYSALVHFISSSYGQLHHRMQSVCDVIWDRLRLTGISWVGFYLLHPDQPEDQRLILGPRRDKPACSPIGMHGVCGRAVDSAAVQIVADVRTL
ncbi:MAG TPA: hypothetical protein VG711_09320, partial [Phycisphaerales bacterium]|nr:hypothetical protein [Phycisphaerales bacterium]